MAKSLFPEKISYRRKEVIAIAKISAQVLEFWEEEFGIVPATVSSDGEKFYSRKELDTVLQIKQLLLTEKKSRQEVRALMFPAGAPGPKEKPPRPATSMQLVLREIREILTLISKNDNKDNKNGA